MCDAFTLKYEGLLALFWERNFEQLARTQIERQSLICTCVRIPYSHSNIYKLSFFTVHGLIAIVAIQVLGRLAAFLYDSYNRRVYEGATTSML